MRRRRGDPTEIVIVVVPGFDAIEAVRRRDVSASAVSWSPPTSVSEPAARSQEVRGSGDDAAHEVEAIGAAVEGDAWFVPLHVGGEEA